MFGRRSPQIPAVDPAEAQARVDAGALLIDVREQREWDEARIGGSVLKPLSQANSWYGDLPEDREIIFYCRSGNRSGRIVHALMEQAGMTNVFNMTGGIIAWAQQGLPVER
jgi:rhodanese-related sulfurtransferase